MGHRIGDEFTVRSCSFLSPAESVKKMLIAIAEDYFGMKVELTGDSVKF